MRIVIESRLHYIHSIAEAMDRIHRLGQYRPVQAIKLVVEDSIESRIVQASDISNPPNCEVHTWPTVAREEVCHGGCYVVYR